MNDLTKKDIQKIEDIIEIYEFVYIKISEEAEGISGKFEYVRDIDIEKINFLNKKVSRRNFVLIRCLYDFAKACAFASHHMTMEEATALQFFCLDGLSKLFQKKYKISKIKNLGKFLKEKFNCPYGEYLRELHDERTIYVHPSNIHGKYWCPPWDADTCYDTLSIVRDLLLLYLTNKFKPDN